MRRANSFFVASILVGTTALVLAQQPPAAAPVPFERSMQQSYDAVKRNLTGAAEKMPEADYNFKPTTMPEVRTYGRLFGHVANAQYGSCAAAKGAPNPNQGKNLETLTTKTEFQKALADSFAFCDDAFKSLTTANAMEMVARGRGQVTRAFVLADLIAHSEEMYGTAAVYLRAKGIVPPSTEEEAARRGGPGRGRG